MHRKYVREYTLKTKTNKIEDTVKAAARQLYHARKQNVTSHDRHGRFVFE